jgi:hypothetical protein
MVQVYATSRKGVGSSSDGDIKQFKFAYSSIRTIPLGFTITEMSARISISG